MDHQEHRGKPPKTASTIRAALEAMQGSEGAPKVGHTKGPLIDGYDASHPIKIASFHRSDMARKFQKRLSDHSIYSDLVTRSKQTAVFVDAEDSHAAAKIFESTRAEFPNVKPTHLSSRYDFLIFGGLFGLTLGLILIFNVAHHPAAFGVAVTFFVIGALLGHLWDRFNGYLALYGKIRIGLVELMILAAVPALFIMVCQLVPKIILAD